MRHELPHQPAIVGALRRVLSASSKSALAESALTELARLEAANRELAGQAAVVCEGERIFVFGLSDRHLMFLLEAARRTHGSVTVSVASPSWTDQRADADAARLLEATLESAGTVVRSIETVELGECGPAVAGSDRVLVLASAAAHSGELVALRGSELVIEVATSYGPGVTTLLTEDEIVDEVGPYQDPNFVVVGL